MKRKPLADQLLGKPVRMIIPMPRSLLAAVDVAWHKRRLKSRAATVRALLQEALGK